MHAIILRGEVGEVRHVYHRAATVAAWTITGRRLTAEITQADRFHLTQTPLTFEVRRPRGVWRWNLSACTVAGTRLSAIVEEDGSP